MSEVSTESTDAEQPERLAGKWVAGGPSPNPGGRPKAIARLTELARDRTEKAIATLEEIMTNAKASSAARVAAAEALLDRGWGRPRQSIEQTVAPGLTDANGDLVEVTGAVRRDAVRRMLFALRSAEEEAAASVAPQTTYPARAPAELPLNSEDTE